MKELLLWMWLAQIADAKTSCDAINSGRFVEANPTMFGATCGRIVKNKLIISGALTAVVLPKPDNHKKAAKIAVSIMASISTTAALVNIKTTWGK